MKTQLPRTILEHWVGQTARFSGWKKELWQTATAQIRPRGEWPDPKLDNKAHITPKPTQVVEVLVEVQTAIAQDEPRSAL